MSEALDWRRRLEGSAETLERARPLYDDLLDALDARSIDHRRAIGLVTRVQDLAPRVDEAIDAVDIALARGDAPVGTSLVRAKERVARVRIELAQRAGGYGARGEELVSVLERFKPSLLALAPILALDLEASEASAPPLEETFEFGKNDPGWRIGPVGWTARALFPAMLLGWWFLSGWQSLACTAAFVALTLLQKRLEGQRAFEVRLMEHDVVFSPEKGESRRLPYASLVGVDFGSQHVRTPRGRFQVPDSTEGRRLLVELQRLCRATQHRPIDSGKPPAQLPG